jgi:hypothetical protein
VSVRYSPTDGMSPYPQLRAAARLDIPALVDLTAGDMVNIVTSGGVSKAQRANATDASRPADGFVAAAHVAGSIAAVFALTGLHLNVSGLTPGTTYFLATADGAITATAPSGSGNLVQVVGKALSATALMFLPQIGVKRR